MNRNTILLLAGGLFSGLILWDRANSTDIVVAGTVVSVKDHDLTEGPDTWHVIVDTELGPVTLVSRSSRPDLSADDAVCVAVSRRMAGKDSYALAPASTTC